MKLFLSLSLAALVLQAQTQHPSFATASVKPNTASAPGPMKIEFQPGGRFIARSTPLQILITVAYQVPFQSPQLTGPAGWIVSASERYDIEATAEAGAVPLTLPTRLREERMRLMLQSLLADRFQMRMRVEPREQPVYELVVAKNGPKLARSKLQEKECANLTTGTDPSVEGGCHAISGGMGRGVHGSAIGIFELILHVENWSDRLIVDKTGLTSLYDIQTEGWAPMRQRPPNPDGTPPPAEAGINDPDRLTLFNVFERLGLRLQPARATMNMYVVEHVEKPSAN